MNKIQTEIEKRESNDKSTEYDCLKYLDLQDTFKEEYLKKGESIEDYQLDQAPYRNVIGERTFSSFFTWYGIKIIDGWFARQISNESKFSTEQLKEMIRKNPHLHNIIKTNLLENLNSIHGA